MKLEEALKDHSYARRRRYPERDPDYWVVVTLNTPMENLYVCDWLADDWEPG